MTLESKKQQNITVLQMCSYLRNNKFHAQCIESIAEQGLNQVVVSPHAIPAPYRPQSHLITEHYGERKNWSISRKLVYSWKMKDYANHVRELSNLDEVDVVHAHSLYADGLAARTTSKELNVPLVVSIRGGDIDLFPKYYPHWRRKARDVLNAANKIIFANHNFKDYLEKSHNIKLPDEKCQTIPNGVDDIWHETPLAPKPENTEVRVICVGKLTDRKNQLGLIDALKIANQSSGRAYTLTLVGRPIEAYGKSVLKECDINEWISYIGELAPADIIKQFQKHDLFALVSHSENFGIVYGEALSCGLPIIFSEGQGFDGWDTSIPYGVAVNSRDTAAVTKAIVDFNFTSTTPMERKEFSENLFKWSKIAQEHESLYRSTLT